MATNNALEEYRKRLRRNSQNSSASSNGTVGQSITRDPTKQGAYGGMAVATGTPTRSYYGARATTPPTPTVGYAGSSTQSGSGSTQSQGSDPNITESDRERWYRLLREQRYDDLKQEQIQLDNARQQALYYAGQQPGYGQYATQGYGNSAETAIYNQYLNSLADAERSYASDMAEIGTAEADAAAQEEVDRFGSLITSLASVTDDASLSSYNSLLERYGYGTANEDGTFTWGKKPDNLSEDSWQQLRYSYEVTANGVSNAENGGIPDNGSAWYSSTNDLLQATFVSSDGRTGKFNDSLKEMIEMLLSNNTPSQSMPVHVVNPYDEAIDAYLFYDAETGSWQVIDKVTYDEWDGRKMWYNKDFTRYYN